jgi:hypothetical protein
VNDSCKICFSTDVDVFHVLVRVLFMFCVSDANPTLDSLRCRYRQQMAEKERREFVELEKQAQRKVYASKYAAELLGQTLYVQPLQPVPGVSNEEHATMTTVKGEIWLPCVDGLMRCLQHSDSGSGSGFTPQFAPWW